MKSQVTFSYRLPLSLIFSLILTLFFGGAMRGNSAPLSAGLPQAAVPQDSLRIKAQMRGGGYRGREPVERGRLFPGLKEIAQESILVVIGEVAQNTCRLSKDETTITTDYEVVVLETLRGEAKKGDTVTVKMQGGRVMFADQTFAQIIADGGQRMMLNRRTYLLFLTAPPREAQVYKPVGGPQGIFQIAPDTNGSVEPCDLRRTTPLVSRYQGMPTLSFLDEVRRATRK